MNDNVETLKNSLNSEIRGVLKIIDIIDGKSFEYADYKENTLSQEMYLKEQIELVKGAKDRLINIFKD